MNKRLLMGIWFAIMFFSPLIQGAFIQSSIQSNTVFDLESVLPSQYSGYSGVIPMDLTVMVGDSGNDLTNAFNYLAAVPLTIRSNSTHTTSGLVLPDDIEDYASPLNEWLELLGGSLNELVFVGNVQNPDHQALTSIADTHYTISGTDHIEMAANLATEFFAGTSTVVLTEAPFSPLYSDSITIADTSATLNAMYSTSRSGSTSASSDWEYFGTYSPTGGGAIITLTSGDSYIWFDLLAQEGSRYYPMDFPYYDGRTVMYPYDERPGSTWILHAIDFYEYSRTVNLHFDIDIPDADFYTFTVAPGEDCKIDFDLSVIGGTPRNIGLNVLDPSGNIILNANRFALFEGVNEVSEISVSLSHPTPGSYRAYVYSAEDTSVSYDLSIVKNVINNDFQAAAANAANGASLASHLGAPLLYTNGRSLDSVTEQAIQYISPQTVYFMNPTGQGDSTIRNELEALGCNVNAVENFTEVQILLSALDERSNSLGSVALYDSLGTSFAAAGLSATQRGCPAIPYSYADSGLMTLSQIPEQLSWNREYQMPLIATFSLIDFWTNDADFSDMNPPITTMTAIADRFFPWLSSIAGIDSVDNVITIAPYYGPGEALPPSFERALTGLADAGRYSSINTEATLVQLMRSVLRIPLMSLSSRSHEVLGSYLVYSYGDQVMANNRAYRTIDNSNDFSSLVSTSGLSPVMQVGPSTISELNTAPYTWIATIHGGIGYDLYEHDGRVALFYTNTWRGYDSGRSASSPDADTEESPQYVVYPPENYMNIYNISELVTGANLRGMFAFLDSCQVGSSYGPSTIMESGADAVLACRTDTFVGPADMFEYNVVQSMVNNHETLGEAIDSAFDINSHRYALSDIGLDSYVSSSDAAVIGASSLQFIIFGDPDITFYDWNAQCYPIMDRCVSVGPSRTARAHPGSTYHLPLGMHDPVGYIYAYAGTYSINVYDTEDNLLTSGTAICTSTEMGIFDIHFNSASPLGVYDVEITDVNTNDTFYTQVILEWPNLVIHSIESPAYTELGIWNLEILVFNPQDVEAETIVQVSLNNEILLVSEASWLPGFSSHSFELLVIFGSTGSQNLNVLITIGVQTVCCDYDMLVLVSSHWVSPVIWFIIPALSACVVAGGLFTRIKGTKVASLKQGLDAEIAGENGEAFDLYCKNMMSRAATRIAVKENLPEEMMSKLKNQFGRAVFNDLQTLANASVLKGEFRTASRVFFNLDQWEKGSLYKAIADLEEGNIEGAAETFRDLSTLSHYGYAVNLLNHLNTMDDETQSKFVSQSEGDLLYIASKLQRDPSNQELLLSVIKERVDNEHLMRFLMNLGRIEDASQNILSVKSVPKMIKLTQVLNENQQNEIASVVIRLMTPSYKPKEIAKYITSISISDKTKEEAVSPILEQLIQEPSNKDRISALQVVSKSASTGSLKSIDDAIDAIKSVTSAAEGMGVSVEHITSTTLVPVIAGLKDHALGEKLLNQIEKQVLQGSVSGSANIDSLADYVYSLRTAMFAVDDPHPQIKLKLGSYATTLQNRLSQAVQELVTTSQFKIDAENWLQASSDDLADKILSGIPIVDPVSAIIACLSAKDRISPNQISLYLQNSVGVEKQIELANQLMENPIDRDRILRRHMKLKVNEFGRAVWTPDVEAAYRDALIQVLEKWKPQATSAFRLGVFKAALGIAKKSMKSQIPSSELTEISFVFLFNARSMVSSENERFIEYIRDLAKYLNRDEISAIVEKASLPTTILDEAFK